MADVEIVVIGAGVVGLAVAARIARTQTDLIVLERHARHGQETSSRNSEVIHAGLYYPPDSLKTKLCLAGNRALYEICARHTIPHRRLTKLIVATQADEIAPLEALAAHAREIGVDARLLSAHETLALEPSVRAVAGLLSPSTGILSVHALMNHFYAEILHAGAIIQTDSEVVALERRSSDYRLSVRVGAALESLSSRMVINAAGLDSDRIAALAGIDTDAAGYRLHYCKGSYFAANASYPGALRRLVYPLPTHVSLGVHAVLDLAGRLRFGPDVAYLPDRTQDYSVNTDSRAAFGHAVRRYLPTLKDEDLTPDQSGIRPKLQGPGQPARDFVIVDETARGLPGLINLIGIDSPGLTASPAIAAHVAELIAC
ncbi:MAG: NAD(P)/FAD-dependent oxidoreductase [Vicinamibacteria bacterium]|nr:NAD(P)/FAD-dependent oxidoreductase [Vicinamibacteria bacterium]